MNRRHVVSITAVLAVVAFSGAPPFFTDAIATRKLSQQLEEPSLFARIRLLSVLRQVIEDMKAAKN